MRNAQLITIPATNELNIVGADLVDTDRYISPDLTGVYVQSSANILILYQNNANYLKYLINTIPYRAESVCQLHGNIYVGTVVENPTITVLSNGIAFNSIMGVYLQETANCVQISISGQTITTPNTVTNYAIFDYNKVVEYASKSANTGIEFVFFQNCIIQQNVNIQYSNIIHPLITTHFRPLYNTLEYGNNDNIPFTIYGNTNNLSSVTSINLRSLKLLFSADGTTWYTYNTTTSSFSIVSPIGTYFTFSELCNEGISYTTYKTIPYTAFTTTFGTSVNNLLVLSNGWILPRYVKHSLYKDKTDSSNFLWFNTNADAKRAVYVGNI